MKLPRIRLAIRHHPRLTMGTIIATVFVVIGAYGLWSVNVWSQYEVSYERWERDLHTDIDSGFALPVKNAQDRLRKLAAFKDISSDITSARESLCTVHGMFRWQDIIPAL
jgi:hypothetical protein